MFDMDIPGLYFLSKTSKLQYSSFSENLAKLIDIDSPKKALGKTDFDLCWKTQAKFYTSTDKKILEERILYFNKVEIIPKGDQIIKILISKYPLQNNLGDCIGVAGYFTEITHHNFTRNKGYIDYTTNRFYFDENATDKYFTPRELEVLKLLMTGYQSKKIALILKISSRTADEYIDNIKTKLNCYTKSEVILSAFKLGLSHLIFDSEKQ